MAQAVGLNTSVVSIMLFLTTDILLMALRQMSSTELDRSAINIEQIEGLHFVCMLIQPVSVEQII